MILYGISNDAFVQCEPCRATFQANALSFRLNCPACGKATPTHQKKWVEQLTQVLRAYEDWPRGHKEPTVHVDGPIGSVMIGYEAPLACSQCQTALSIEDIDRATKERALSCVKCGTETFFRRPPDGISSLGVEFLVGEDPTAAEGTARPLHVATEPIVMHCPNCGASVPLEGSARSKHCGYCSAEVVIPDSIWRRLHPDAGRPPWYLTFTPERHHQLFYRAGSKRALRDAADAKTPGDALAYLSRQRDEQVQKLVAANPSAPDAAFAVLAQSPFPNVVQALVDRFAKHGGSDELRNIVESIKSARDVRRQHREDREAALRAEEEARQAREAEQARSAQRAREAAEERERQRAEQQRAEREAQERVRQEALVAARQSADARRRTFVGLAVAGAVIAVVIAAAAFILR